MYYNVPHLEKDLSYLGANFEQRMQMATLGHRTHRVQIQLLELLLFPQIAVHFTAKTRRLFDQNLPNCYNALFNDLLT